MADYISIPFTKTDGTYTLQDALHLTIDQIDALGEDGIEAMKQERFDNWLIAITTPSVDLPVEPAPEQGA